jgi:hypothetical protein
MRLYFQLDSNFLDFSHIFLPLNPVAMQPALLPGKWYYNPLPPPPTSKALFCILLFASFNDTKLAFIILIPDPFLSTIENLSIDDPSNYGGSAPANKPELYIRVVLLAVLSAPKAPTTNENFRRGFPHIPSQNSEVVFLIDHYMSLLLILHFEIHNKSATRRSFL